MSQYYVNRISSQYTDYRFFIHGIIRLGLCWKESGRTENMINLYLINYNIEIYKERLQSLSGFSH